MTTVADLLRHPFWRILALVGILLSAAPACGSDEGAPPVDRETFVAVWVDLRLAAIASQGGTADPATRERIVERHGTSREELLAFIETHGRDIVYMERVWQDVETRMNELAPAADTTTG